MDISNTLESKIEVPIKSSHPIQPKPSISFYDRISFRNCYSNVLTIN